MSETITYRCAECGWEGESAWTDEEARAEAKANGFDLDGDEPMAVICDDCYQSRPWPRDTQEEDSQ